MKDHALSIPVLMLALALIVSGCQNEHPLKVGSNQWPGYEPVFLARELGLLSEDDSKLVELPSSTEVMQYLRNGSLDGGLLTLDEVLTLRAEGIPLQVVLLLDLSDGADSVLAQPHITSLSDLRGRKVGVEVSAVGALMLQALLERAGLQREDVQLVNLTADEHAQAFLQKQVDVLVTFEPTRSQLLKAGARELFNSHEIPGKIIDVLAVRKNALPHHGEQVKKLIQSYFSARAYMDAYPDKAFRLIAPRLGGPADNLQTLFSGIYLPDQKENRHWLASGQLRERAQSIAQLMQQWQLLDSMPPVDDLSNAEYLPAP